MLTVGDGKKDLVLTISQNAILAECTAENRETRHLLC
jgi:hypothetical protein